MLSSVKLGYLSSGHPVVTVDIFLERRKDSFFVFLGGICMMWLKLNSQLLRGLTVGLGMSSNLFTIVYWLWASLRLDHHKDWVEGCLLESVKSV